MIVVLLSVGYILVIFEIFVPGGVLGVLGTISIAYGCYLAFSISTGWGFGAVGISVVVTFVGLRMFLRSRAINRLILDNDQPKAWKAPDTRLPDLEGKEGRTLSALRPAGTAEIDDQRIDVVSDSEFIGAGLRIRVVEVEGTRVVVEAVETDDVVP